MVVKKMVKHDAQHNELPSFAPYEQKVTTSNEIIKKLMHKYKLPHKDHIPTSTIQFIRSLIFKQIYFYDQYSWACGISPPKLSVQYCIRTLQLIRLVPQNISDFH